MPHVSDEAETHQIRTNDDLTAALTRIDALWGAKPGSPEGDELDILVDLVEHYEAEHAYNSDMDQEPPT